MLPGAHLDGFEIEVMDLTGLEGGHVEPFYHRFALDDIALRGWRRHGERRQSGYQDKH
jgi:hypothetical protein